MLLLAHFHFHPLMLILHAILRAFGN